jgi:hypothetical protein
VEWIFTPSIDKSDDETFVKCSESRYKLERGLKVTIRQEAAVTPLDLLDVFDLRLD